MVDVGGSDEDEIHIDVEILVIDNMKEGMERIDVRHGANEQKKRRQELWDVHTHWQMVDEAQAMVDEVEGNKGLEADSDWEYVENMELWDVELFVCSKWESNPN
jgi:hypothetical protein